MGHANKQFESLGIAVLTVSDTRDRSTDTSGEYLAVNATESGHQVIKRDIVIDDIYLIRACVSSRNRHWRYRIHFERFYPRGSTTLV